MKPKKHSILTIRRVNIFVFWVLLIFVLLNWVKVIEISAFNFMAVNTSKFVLGTQPTDMAVLNKSQSCRKHWFEGYIYQAQGEREERDRHWRAAVQCSPNFIDMLSLIIPEDQVMAEFAAVSHPESAEAWFWLAQFEDERAIEFYERGLALNPTAGLRWKEYGDLLVTENPERSMQAYFQSCLNGDPGYNSCWLAGQMAEQLNDIPLAIRYYRYSLWEGALKRADELERALTSAQER